jgi:hypothetical protein
MAQSGDEVVVVIGFASTGWADKLTAVAMNTKGTNLLLIAAPSFNDANTA